MASRGRLAATVLLAILIGGAARQDQGEAPGEKATCYNGDMGKDGKGTPGKCEGKGMTLIDIDWVTGSRLETEETGCWKDQGERKAVRPCKMGECSNSKEHQDGAFGFSPFSVFSVFAFLLYTLTAVPRRSMLLLLMACALAIPTTESVRPHTRGNPQGFHQGQVQPFRRNRGARAGQPVPARVQAAAAAAAAAAAGNQQAAAPVLNAPLPIVAQPAAAAAVPPVAPIPIHAQPAQPGLGNAGAVPAAQAILDQLAQMQAQIDAVEAESAHMRIEARRQHAGMMRQMMRQHQELQQLLQYAISLFALVIFFPRHNHGTR